MTPLHIKRSSLALKLQPNVGKSERSKSEPFEIRTKFSSVSQTEGSVFGASLYIRCLKSEVLENRAIIECEIHASSILRQLLFVLNLQKLHLQLLIAVSNP